MKNKTKPDGKGFIICFLITVGMFSVFFGIVIGALYLLGLLPAAWN